MNNLFYEYVFRGLLTEKALDLAGRKSRTHLDDETLLRLSERLSINQVSDEFVTPARKMSLVYVAISSFENSVREFITKKMLEEVGEDWWNSRVSEKIKKTADSRKEDESKQKYLTPRGDDPINYTDFGDLFSIVQRQENWPLFEPHLGEIDWVKGIFMSLEKSRNIIMHSGALEEVDIERVGMNIRDWIRQVG